MQTQKPGEGGIFGVKNMGVVVDGEGGDYMLPSVSLFESNTTSPWSGNRYAHIEPTLAAMETFAARKEVFGELGNPYVDELFGEEKFNRVASVDMDNAPVKYNNLRVEKTEGGARIVGDIHVLDTQTGQVVRKHLEEDGRFRPSMRCAGRDDSGVFAISTIFTFDILIDPVNINWPIDDSLYVQPD